MNVTEKPNRTSCIEIGDTVFTVISVESDSATERLFDKVKRLVLNQDMASYYEANRTTTDI